MGQALGYLKFGLFDNKKPCFMCGSEVLKCGYRLYTCIILYRLAILVGDNPLKPPVENGGDITQKPVFGG